MGNHWSFLDYGCYSSKELREIVSNNKLSWKLALSYIKAVYVITDTKTGKLYIDSASGNSQGLWQRWECYADFRELTGENKEFENLVNKNGRNYIQDNFKYFILEIFDTKTRWEYILERKNYWRNVFETKKFGMNWDWLQVDKRKKWIRFMWIKYTIQKKKI